jgi:glucose/arabinose dehydrogenase
MRLLHVIAAASLLAMAVCFPAAAAVAQSEPGGAPLVADNVATASAAAAEAPLGPSRVGGFGAGHQISLPDGFNMTEIAAGLGGPRFMTFDAAGNLLVADAQTGAVYRYPAADGTIAPSEAPPRPLLDSLKAPSNVVLHDGFLYVGETQAVSRYAYDANAALGKRQEVVPNLPTDGHNTRTIAFGPDGTMYVAVGSSCNICDESDPRRAAVLRFNPDGSGYARFAWGLRNAVGLAIQPDTGVLWATVNERDNQGNEIPPDLVTALDEGQNFGWPACQPPDAVPQSPGNDCSGITPPSVAIQAHGAPLGLAFYSGQQFPSDYAGDLFVVQHGSWNREPPAPPKILRLHFEGDAPVRVQDFASGWQTPDTNRWGRPAGVVVAPDGSLIVSDDTSGVLYRISYAAPAS